VYYRSMFRGRVSSWNLRDRHMAETLAALVAHLDRTRRRPSKVVVWAHSSHLGDARGTQMGAAGELNLGQLARERYGHEVVLIGFTTYTGTVTAAADWGAPAERRHVRPGLTGSYEALFHDTGLPGFLLVLRDAGPAVERLRRPRLERAIGVIYRQETERRSHYFEARLPEQFDAVLHYDETRAVEPLERWGRQGGAGCPGDVSLRRRAAAPPNSMISHARARCESWWRHSKGGRAAGEPRSSRP
jgi:erythromycin esterase-like protein